MRGRPNFDMDSAQPGESYQVEWVTVDEPNPLTDTVRYQAQAKGAAIFNRTEGIWATDKGVYFDCTSGGDAGLGQLWELRPKGRDGGTLKLIFESTTAEDLEAPDNLVVVPSTGDVFLQEDGPGTQYVRGVTPKGLIYDFARTMVKPHRVLRRLLLARRFDVLHQPAGRPAGGRSDPGVAARLDRRADVRRLGRLQPPQGRLGGLRPPGARGRGGSATPPPPRRARAAPRPSRRARRSSAARAAARARRPGSRAARSRVGDDVEGRHHLGAVLGRDRRAQRPQAAEEGDAEARAADQGADPEQRGRLGPGREDDRDHAGGQRERADGGTGPGRGRAERELRGGARAGQGEHAQPGHEVVVGVEEAAPTAPGRARGTGRRSTSSRPRPARRGRTGGGRSRGRAAAAASGGRLPVPATGSGIRSAPAKAIAKSTSRTT